MVAKLSAGVYPVSAMCTKACGRLRQTGKDGMCCRCWRVANGLQGRRAPYPPRRRADDPLADAWAELDASGVPPESLLTPIVDVPNTAPKVGGYRCRKCRLRWPQTYGLCCECASELAAADGYASTRLYLEAMHATQVAMKDAGAIRPVVVPRPVSTLVADGIEYEVESSSVRPLEPGEVEREITRARTPASL